MIFDLKDLEIQVLKKFDGVNNYFNPSHFNGKTIFRRESKFDNKLLISDIVDDQDVVLLQHNTDDMYLWSYEDARFINENEIGVCCCKRDKNDIEKIINVEYKKYNLLTKEFTHFKTQNAHFEKHWQFCNDTIIYHVNPYTILDNYENVIFKKQINWDPWIEKYGKPGLSTNVFEIDEKKFLLFHSYVTKNGISLKYYVGLLQLDVDLHPIGYYNRPLFNSTEYYDHILFIKYFNWKRKLDPTPTIADIIFPMNVIIDDVYINVYSGLNDCNAVCIKINLVEFVDKLKSETFTII
jgi:hypothetical protein